MRLALALLAIAANNLFAGSWKFDTAKSVGPAPSCVQNGILSVRTELRDGHMLTQAQMNPASKAVFERR